MAFNADAARRAGYSDAEIIEHLARQRGFNVDGARQSGYSDQEIIRHLSEPPQRGVAERAARGVGQVGAGFNEGLARAIGGPFDLVNAGLRWAGVPIPEGSVTDMVQGGINAVVGQPQTPETTTEEALRGAGRGVADAASVFMPATAITHLPRAAGSIGAVPGVTRGAAQALATQPAIQAASGAAGGAVGEVTDSPLLGTAAAIATPALLAGARRLVTPAGTIDPERAALAAVAREEGIPLTPGQQTGSRAMRNVEAAFETLPTTAGRQAQINSGQQDAFNRAVLQRAGITGNRATPDVLAAAQDRIGGEIGAIAGRTQAQAPLAVRQSFQSVADDVTRNAAPEVRQQVLNRLEDVRNLFRRGYAEGAAVRELDTAIGAQIRGAQGDLRNYLREVQNILRDAMTAGAGPEDAAALGLARGQYRNLVQVENAMGAAGEAAATGNIGANQLRAAVTQGDRRGYALGRGDLNELSRVGQAFVRPQIPNSGTPERTMMANMLTGGTGGGAAAIMGADPLVAMGVATASMAAPRIAQRAYNSDLMARYLTNQLLAGAGPHMDQGLAAALLAGPGREMLIQQLQAQTP